MKLRRRSANVRPQIWGKLTPISILRPIWQAREALAFWNRVAIVLDCRKDRLNRG